MVDIHQALGYYAFCIAVFGTIGNSIIAYVSIKSQKTNSTFVLFRYLAFSDTLTLYFWNIGHFISSSFGLDIENFNLYLCKFGNWIQYSSLQSSAWILVLHLFNHSYIGVVFKKVKKLINIQHYSIYLLYQLKNYS